MTEETTNLVLEHLKHIRRVGDETREDMADVKLRVSAIEEHIGQMQIQFGGLNRRMDRFDERLTRVERRLELTETH
jgi:archaellum component FlaC